MTICRMKDVLELLKRLVPQSEEDRVLKVEAIKFLGLVIELGGPPIR